MNFKRKLAISTIAMLMAVGPMIAMSSQNTSPTQAAVSEKKEGTIKIRARGARVYGRNGEQLKTYKGSEKNTFLKEGTVVKYYGLPKYMTKKLTVSYASGITHVKNMFYYIGDGGYVLGYNVESLDGKGTLSVYHNAYVYDKNGKRLKSYRGSKKNTLIRKSSAINYVGKLNEMNNTSENIPDYYYFNGINQYYSTKMLWVSYHTIKGKPYYNIGNGGYIKAANIGYVNGKLLYTSEGTIVLGKPFQLDNKYHIWNKDGKMTKKILPYKKGDKITVDRWINVDGFSYFKIKGKNIYISEKDVKKKPSHSIRS